MSLSMKRYCSQLGQMFVKDFKYKGFSVCMAFILRLCSKFEIIQDFCMYIFQEDEKRQNFVAKKIC